MQFLKRISILILAALVLVVGLALAMLQGWHVEKRSPEEIEALLETQLTVYRPRSRASSAETAAVPAMREALLPAVVQFHGCGGVRASQREWARRFNEIGWIAVVVDSNGPRGLEMSQVCGGRALLGGERAGDVLVALDRVRRLEGVDPGRVVLAGWSHGAWSIMDLLAMNPPDELPHNLSRSTASGLEGIAGLVFVYPYCGLGSRGEAWGEDVPSLHLLVDDDSVAPPADCEPVLEGLRERGHPVEIERFAGVDHAFDQADLPPDSRLSYDAASTQRAQNRVVDFLMALPGSR